MREEHEATLHKVLDRIREYGLRLKRSKCQFFQEELEFLGHVISKMVLNQHRTASTVSRHTVVCQRPRKREKILKRAGILPVLFTSLIK